MKAILADACVVGKLTRPCLKVLTNCMGGVGEQAYALRKLTPSKEQLEIDNEDKLASELPLGFASLRGELREGRSLSLDYLVMGQRQAVSQPTQLEGDCRGATHYVKTMTVGAYALLARAERHALANAQAFGADANASSRGYTKHLRGVGNLEDCASKPDVSSCHGILQLSLVELPKNIAPSANIATRQATQTAGFGQGLGRMAELPSVGRLSEFQGASSLAEADPRLLELLQA